MDPKFRKPKKNIDDFIRYSNLAFEMVAIMGIGTWLGWKIDGWVHTGFPAFTLVFMVFSVIGAIFYAIRRFL